MKTVFLRVLEAEDKAAALLELARESGPAGNASRFEIRCSDFGYISGSPFSYWTAPSLRRVFRSFERFSSHGRHARSGAFTGDDDRFVRLWYEPQGEHWVPLAKGGSRAPFYADVHMVITWAEDGAELKAFASQYRARKGWGDQWTAVLNGYDQYFKRGLTWPHRSARFTVAAMPAGCVFTKSGKAAFMADEELPVFLAILNSRMSTQLARTLSDAVRIKFEAGLVGKLPVPTVTISDAKVLSGLSRAAWSRRRVLDSRTETSHAFSLPALLQVPGSLLAARARAWARYAGEIRDELEVIQRQVDEYCLKLYGIDAADPGAFGEGSIAGTPGVDPEIPDSEEELEEEELEEEVGDTAGLADEASLASELISWTVGVAFGRFDARLATGTRELPREPEPFDPLPVCSPGMLTTRDALPARIAPSGYPLDWPNDGIMVDDSGHPNDLAARVRRVLEVVFDGAADAWWQECVRLLGNDLNSWLTSRFFDVHLRGYSKSRRKAPIYWQLATPSASYSVWLYAPKASADTLYRVLSDYVAPKLLHEERNLTRAVQEAGSSPTASHRRAIELQRDFVEELRLFRDEVARVAPLWRSELDDGILITCAPLWRLFPQHRAWQRETRACWDKLAKGEYDWSHLAMHLWPERVVPQCEPDRSLAIAHELEEIFWAEGVDGKWVSREVEDATVERLVQERSSAAVAAARDELTAAG